jgi:hypothetical protein
VGVSCEELLKARSLRPDDRKVSRAYYDERHATREGQVVGGLEWARNRVVHELRGVAAVIDEGAAIGLPALIDPLDRFAFGRDRCYQQLVAGEPLRRPLAVAFEFVRPVRLIRAVRIALYCRPVVDR